MVAAAQQAAPRDHPLEHRNCWKKSFTSQFLHSRTFQFVPAKKRRVNRNESNGKWCITSRWSLGWRRASGKKHQSKSSRKRLAMQCRARCCGVSWLQGKNWQTQLAHNPTETMEISSKGGDEIVSRLPDGDATAARYLQSFLPA